MTKHFLTVVYQIDDKPETVEAILSQRPWQAVAHTDALQDLEYAQADLQATTEGYDAARLQIKSLQAALETYKQSCTDWAARTHALESTTHQQRTRIEELEAQLDAVGAGGVEPLRKRECLHQIDEQAPSEWDVRGHLAASLTCWPRLTGQEASELVALFHGRSAQADAPVVLPAPDAVLRFERSTAGKENEMPSVVSCNWLPDGEYKLYTEQQVRAMLAAAPKPPARKPLRCSCHTCWPIAADDPASTFMRLCPACGNKRCPKANDHRHACTGSNEPGQPGSAYQLTGGITAAQKGDAHG